MMTVRTFRIVAVVEAVSFLLLLAASVAKRAFDLPGFVPVLGPIHGLIFLAYFVCAVFLREELGWSGLKTAGVVAAAVIPLGGLYVERRYLEPAPEESRAAVERSRDVGRDGG